MNIGTELHQISTISEENDLGITFIRNSTESEQGFRYY